MKVLVNKLTGDIFIKLPIIEVPQEGSWIVFNELHTTMDKTYQSYEKKVDVDLIVVKRLSTPDESIEYLFNHYKDSPISKYDSYLVISDFGYNTKLSSMKTISKVLSINSIVKRIKLSDIITKGLVLCTKQNIDKLMVDTKDNFLTHEIDLDLSQVIGYSKKGDNTWVLNEIISRSGKNIHNTRPSSL